MDYTKTLAALSHCEVQLRAELASAAQAGDYTAIGLVSQWAQTVAALAAEAARELGDPPPNKASSATPPEARAASPRATRSPKLSYPRFVRTAEAIVKIGWSKKAKAEYEHKAPLALAEQLAAGATKVGVKGKVFSIETLVTALLGDGHSPSYQHYLVVAWWRDAGLIKQHGRKGYSIPRPTMFLAEATQRLDALPPHGN